MLLLDVFHLAIANTVLAGACAFGFKRSQHQTVREGLDLEQKLFIVLQERQQDVEITITNVSIGSGNNTVRKISSE